MANRKQDFRGFLRTLGPVLIYTRCPHPEEPRSGVSKDAGPSVASWFETALRASSP